jgi:hypothetical protein
MDATAAATPECAECSSERWGVSGCVDGSWYGLCASEFCDGMCEYLGECDCTCHGDAG